MERYRLSALMKDVEMGGDIDVVIAADAQRALDAEREKVAFLEKKNANLVEASNLVLKVKAEQDEQLATLQARATELERDNAAMKQLFDANPSALWAQLATLQAQLAAEQHRADRAVQDRRDALDVKTKEGMSCSEWLMRTATAERQVNELKAQLRQVEGQSQQQAEEAVIVFAKYTTLRQLVEAFVQHFDSDFENPGLELYGRVNGGEISNGGKGLNELLAKARAAQDAPHPTEERS